MPYNGPIPAGFQGVPPGGMPGFMMNQSGPWAGNGMVAGDHPGLHQPGVMRRGNRYNNNRSSGPYDRRGRYNAAGSGRLSPVQGMYKPGGRMPANAGAAFIPPGHPAAAMVPGGFPDAGSPQGMGPREAVQGRSLKSYEDLDAVGGAGGGELNY